MATGQSSGAPSGSTIVLDGYEARRGARAGVNTGAATLRVDI